jgi:hypothetical protein
MRINGAVADEIDTCLLEEQDVDLAGDAVPACLEDPPEGLDDLRSALGAPDATTRERRVGVLAPFVGLLVDADTNPSPVWQVALSGAF